MVPKEEAGRKPGSFTVLNNPGGALAWASEGAGALPPNREVYSAASA